MKCGLCNGNENFEILWENDVAYLAFDNYGVHYAHLSVSYTHLTLPTT